MLLPAFVAVLLLVTLGAELDTLAAFLGAAIVVVVASGLVRSLPALGIALMAWAFLHGFDVGSPGELGWDTRADLPRLTLLALLALCASSAGALMSMGDATSTVPEPGGQRLTSGPGEIGHGEASVASDHVSAYAEFDRERDSGA